MKQILFKNFREETEKVRQTCLFTGIPFNNKLFVKSYVNKKLSKKEQDE